MRWNEVSKLCFHEGRKMAMYEELGVKLLVGYIALFILTRMLGKRNIGQLSAMDFIATLMLSEFLGNALYDTNVQVEEFLFASIIWVILILFSEYLSRRSRFFRDWTKGKPVILISKGTIDWNLLEWHKMDIQDLLELLRTNNVFSIKDVHYGILENNGTLSVMKRPEKEQPDRSDLKLAFPPEDLSFPVIENGRFQRIICWRIK
jgi:uncharacterized membrane protein YcaP (DUF421 family)